MKRISLAIVLALSASAGAKSYTDNKKTVSQDCAEDGEASIAGNGNTITLTGTCTKISVMGNDNVIIVASAKEVSVMGNTNKVTIGETDSIRAMGNKNSVSWKKGITDKDKGPAVQSPGKDNKISQEK